MQKNKKKEEIKITLENCEGYSKLHNKYSLNQDESNKMKKNIKKKFGYYSYSHTFICSICNSWCRKVDSGISIFLWSFYSCNCFFAKFI